MYPVLFLVLCCEKAQIGWSGFQGQSYFVDSTIFGERSESSAYGFRFGSFGLGGSALSTGFGCGLSGFSGLTKGFGGTRGLVPARYLSIRLSNFKRSG